MSQAPYRLTPNMMLMQVNYVCCAADMCLQLADHTCALIGRLPVCHLSYPYTGVSNECLVCEIWLCHCVSIYASLGTSDMPWSIVWLVPQPSIYAGGAL